MENLEEEIDRLYALDPGAFTAERDRLARDLRTVDRREEAAQVKLLRKPTLPAWTINQLARQERRTVDLLLDAGHRLREAQQSLASGEEVGGFDEARRNEGAALAELRKAAARILAEAGRGSEAVLDRISQTLHAAAISSEGRELLARGRLTGELEVTGFELLVPLSEGQTPRPPRQREPEQKARRSAGASSARQREKEQERVEEAQRLVRETRSNAKATATKAHAAERDAAKARKHLAEAQERLSKAQAVAAEADSLARRAEKKLRELERKTP